jgi:hypothetical protein
MPGTDPPEKVVSTATHYPLDGAALAAAQRGAPLALVAGQWSATIPTGAQAWSPTPESAALVAGASVGADGETLLCADGVKRHLDAVKIADGGHLVIAVSV